MEILSTQILNNSPSSFFGFWILLVVTTFLLVVGIYWLYEIITKKDKFSVGAIVFTLMGIFFGWITLMIIKDETYEYEQVKALVTDWNVVYEEGWEVVDQDGKIVILERRVGE